MFEGGGGYHHDPSTRTRPAAHHPTERDINSALLTLAKETTHISNAQRSASRSVHDRGNEAAFAILQLHHFRLDRISGNQSIDVDLLRLSDTVRTVNCLFLSRRIPPRVHDVHVVSFRQCQTGTPRLQRNEEDLGHTRAETLNNLLTVARRSVQLHDGHTAPLQDVSDARQERRELAEDQSSMPQRHNLIKTIGHVLDLR